VKRSYASVFLVALASVFISLLGGANAQAEPSGSTAAFRQLTSLKGQWTGVHNGESVLVSYTLIADGTTLVEEFRPAKGATMMTMFSVDGDHLIATHYCSAGNQPQMISAPIERPHNELFAFSLLRVAGMTSSEDWHNIGLEIDLEDKEHMTQRWTWLDHGKQGTTVFHFTRNHT
jgi:hypothetical protein